MLSDTCDQLPTAPTPAPAPLVPLVSEPNPRLPAGLASEGAEWLRGKGVFLDTTTACCVQTAQLGRLRDLLPRAGATARSFFDRTDVQLVVTHRKPPPAQERGKEAPKAPCKPAVSMSSRRAAQMLLAAGGPRPSSAAAPADGRVTLWDQAEHRGVAVVRPADLVRLLVPHCAAQAKCTEPPAKWMVLKVVRRPPPPPPPPPAPPPPHTHSPASSPLAALLRSTC